MEVWGWESEVVGGWEVECEWVKRVCGLRGIVCARKGCLVNTAIIFPHTHTHTHMQIEAGQYCSFVIYTDGTMKACGKVSIVVMCIHIH